MAKIFFNPSKTDLCKKTLSISVDDSLMKVLLLAGIPVASSCHGEGICGKCKITITKGIHHILPESELEINLKKKNNLNENERFACLIKITDDVEIDTSYW